MGLKKAHLASHLSIPTYTYFSTCEQVPPAYPQTKIEIYFSKYTGDRSSQGGTLGKNEHGMDIGEGTTQGGTLGRYIEEGNLGGSNTG